MERIDISGLTPLIRQAKITVMCDVTNPLCGENGATYTFGKQKGGTLKILDQLESGMQHYRDVIRNTFQTDPDQIPGTGAAGGLGEAMADAVMLYQKDAVRMFRMIRAGMRVAKKGKR